MTSQCLKCHKKTKDIGEPQFIQKGKKYRRLSVCRVCSYNKNLPSKDPEVIEMEELFKASRKNFETRKYIQFGIDDTWQADLYMFYRSKGTQEDPTYNFRNERVQKKENIYKRMLKINNGYVYILNVIDIFSKYVWSVPLKTKTGKEVADAFVHIFNTTKRRPKKLHVDRGKEFYNTNVKRVLNSLDIEIYSTQTDKKASIVERFNRTLGDKLKPLIYKEKKWIDKLQGVIQTYNNTFHRTIKMKPKEVNINNETALLTNVYQIDSTKSKRKFEVGDRVRISSHVFKFRNKLKTNWAKEIFTITEAHTSNVHYYKVAGIDACFYESELALTKL